MIQPPMQSPIKQYFSDAREDEYTLAQVIEITGFISQKIQKLLREGKIQSTRKGFYTRESVDAFKKDRDERLAMKPCEWVEWGSQV